MVILPNGSRLRRHQDGGQLLGGGGQLLARAAEEAPPWHIRGLMSSFKISATTTTTERAINFPRWPLGRPTLASSPTPNSAPSRPLPLLAGWLAGKHSSRLLSCQLARYLFAKTLATRAKFSFKLQANCNSKLFRSLSRIVQSR